MIESLNRPHIRFCNESESIGKLRSLVIDLAVRGDLKKNDDDYPEQRMKLMIHDKNSLIEHITKEKN